MLCRNLRLQSVLAFCSVSSLLLTSCAPSRAGQVAAKLGSQPQALAFNSEALSLEQKGAKPLPIKIREQLTVLNGLTAISVRNLEDPIPELLRALLLTVSKRDVNSIQSLGEVLLSMKPSLLLESDQIAYGDEILRINLDPARLVAPNREVEISFSTMMTLRERYSYLKDDSGEEYANKELLKDLKPFKHSLLTVLNRSFVHSKNSKFRDAYRKIFLSQLSGDYRDGADPFSKDSVLLKELLEDQNTTRELKKLIHQISVDQTVTNPVMSEATVMANLEQLNSTVISDHFVETRKHLDEADSLDSGSKMGLEVLAAKVKALMNLSATIAETFCNKRRYADKVWSASKRIDHFVSLVSFELNHGERSDSILGTVTLDAVLSLLDLSENEYPNKATLSLIENFKELVRSLRKSMQSADRRVDQILDVLMGLDLKWRSVEDIRSAVQKIRDQSVSGELDFGPGSTEIDDRVNADFNSRHRSHFRKCVDFDPSHEGEFSPNLDQKLSPNEVSDCLDGFFEIATTGAENEMRSGDYDLSRQSLLYRVHSKDASFRIGLIRKLYLSAFGSLTDWTSRPFHVGDWMIGGEEFLRFVQHYRVDAAKHQSLKTQISQLVRIGDEIQSDYRRIGSGEFLDNLLQRLDLAFRGCLIGKCDVEKYEIAYELLRISLTSVYGNYYSHRIILRSDDFSSSDGFPLASELRELSGLELPYQDEAVRKLWRRFDNGFGSVREFIRLVDSSTRFDLVPSPVPTVVDSTLSRLKALLLATTTSDSQPKLLAPAARRGRQLR